MYCKVGAKKALILTTAFKRKAGTYLAWGATLLVIILAACGIPAVGPGPMMRCMRAPLHPRNRLLSLMKAIPEKKSKLS